MVVRNVWKKTILSLLFVIIAVAGFRFLAYSEASKDLTKDEAKQILSQLAPDVEVISIAPASVADLWEVVANAGGRKTIVYIDATKKNVFIGSILNIETKKNITKERFEEFNKVDVSQIPLKDSLILGDPKAKIKVFVFTDPDCPYCVKLHPELKKATETRKDIAFYIKLFPLPMHPQAAEKSKAIACEKSNDKAVKMLEDAYDKKEIAKPSCDTKAIEENLKIGQALGINGTPTLVLPTGKLMSGAMQADELIQQIDNSTK
ncbi:MAG: DsbC family protein [bacterium]